MGSTPTQTHQSRGDGAIWLSGLLGVGAMSEGPETGGGGGGMGQGRRAWEWSESEREARGGNRAQCRAPKSGPCPLPSLLFFFSSPPSQPWPSVILPSALLLIHRRRRHLVPVIPPSRERDEKRIGRRVSRHQSLPNIPVFSPSRFRTSIYKWNP